MRIRKRGLSGIVVTVLLILIVFAAIVIVWNVVRNTLSNSTEDINVDIFSTELRLSNIYVNYVSEDIFVSVERGSDNANLDSIKVILAGENSKEYTISGEDIPKTLEKRNWRFDTVGINPINKISVYPVFQKGKIGMEERYDLKASDEKNPPSGWEGAYFSVCTPACAEGETCLKGGCIIKLKNCGTLDKEGMTYFLENDLTQTGTCFEITGDNIILDGKGRKITGDYSPGSSQNSYGISANGRKGITIKNFEGISKFYYGIYLVSSSNNQLINITANSNEAGIDLDSNSNNNQLTNITANSNSYDGIFLYSSSNNQLINITTNNNAEFGINFEQNSNNNQLTNITANNNGAGIYFYSSSNNKLDDSNLCGNVNDVLCEGTSENTFGSIGSNHCANSEACSLTNCLPCP